MSPTFIMSSWNVKPIYRLQGIMLDILVAIGIIKSNHFWLDVEHLQEALQNVLVIVEMVFFSLLMQYAYSAEPYRTGSVSAKAEEKKKE